jgi:hypothetical protein
MVCIDDLAWFLEAWLCSSRFSFLVISEPFLGISVGKFWGCFSCASLLGDLDPTNPLKRLQFECFQWFPREDDLEG